MTAHEEMMQKSSSPGKGQNDERVAEAAARLKAAREAYGYPTAVAAADALGVARSTYIQHESGARPYPYRRALMYGAAFGVQPEYLLAGEAALLRGPAKVPIVGVLGRVFHKSPGRSDPAEGWIWPPVDSFSAAALTAVRADREYAALLGAESDNAVVICANPIFTGIAVGDAVLLELELGDGIKILDLGLAIKVEATAAGGRMLVQRLASPEPLFLPTDEGVPEQVLGVVNWVVLEALDRRRPAFLIPPPHLAAIEEMMKNAS